MRRLGPVILASVLLGVPRALEARAFGARRPVYVEISPASPRLRSFAEALEHALAREPGWSLRPCRRETAAVIDVVAVASARDSRGRAVEAITLSLCEGARRARIVVQAPACRYHDAARALLARL